MRQRRNNLDIIADILKVAKYGAKKTRIVYKANLNFKILDEYLIELTEAGLVDSNREGNNIIQTTDRGIQYLNYYNGFKQFVNAIIV